VTRLSGGLVVLLVWAGLLVAAGPASATVFVDSFFGNLTGSGSGGGLFSEPRGVAVNDATGAAYVVDARNQRVQQFDASGAFVRAWGRDVDTAAGTGFEVCVVAGSCKAGVIGEEGGMFAFAGTSSCSTSSPCGGGIAINQATGDLYVTDARNLRVQQFTSSGVFIRAWGQDVIVSGQPNDSGTGFEVCDTTAAIPNVAGDCKAGIAGETGGAFAAVFDGYPAVAPAGAPNAGNLVVPDPGNRRVQEFTPTGGFVRAFGADVNTPAGGAAFEICTTIADCQAGPAGSGPGQPAGRFGNEQPKSVAVDTTGAIYATEPTFAGGNFRIQKLTPQTGPSALTPTIFAPESLSDVGAGRSPLSVAVDPATNRVYVIKGTPEGASTCADGSPSAANEQRLLELNAAGELLDTSLACAGFTFSRSTFGLALRPSAGEVLVSSTLAISATTGNPSGNAHRVYVLDGDGITAAVASINPATAVTDVSAQLSGTVNPNSVDNPFAPTVWRLQYSRNGVDWLTASQGSLAAGTAPVAVSGSATGLLANTTYRVRIVTQKPFANPEVASPELTLLTDAVKPELAAVRADSITQNGARLTGQVNPHSTLTGYRFEWGEQGGPLDRVVPIPDGTVGDGPVAVFVSEQLSGLQPATTYRFRLVATSTTEGATTSAIETFTTPSAASGSWGRAFELVSPADKFGGTGVGEWYRGPGSMAQSGVAAHEGERFAVQGLFGSVLLSDPAFSFANDWALADRVNDELGWRSHSPLTHSSHSDALASFLALQASSADLSGLAWGANHMPTFFPGLLQGPDDANRMPLYRSAGMYLSDWGTPPASPTRWELVGPDDPDLLANKSMFDATIPSSLWDVKYSADGSMAVGMTALDESASPRLPLVAGLAGPGDPSFADWSTLNLGGLVSGRLIYAADLSDGLSDRLEIGDRELVNVCTGGAGVDRTRLPAVDGGAVVGLDCPDALAGDDDRLVSPLGAALKTADNSAGSIAGRVSGDGSRTFFMSPDPQATGAPNGTSTFCSGSGEATVCPPQLYVREDDGEGPATVRWISRAADGLLGAQAPGLTGAVRFEGASADGRRVFFRTNSPLTADDPNGVKDVSGNVVAPPPGGVTTGTASNSSWDLYMYELPADQGADIGDGQLTRISGGPDGAGDCNSPLLAPSSSVGDDGTVGALRFASADGARAYFTCAAPLPGVAAPGNGTITSPGGDVTTGDQANLYLHDLTRPAGERWRFIARLPRTVSSAGSRDIDICATTGTVPRSPINARDKGADLLLEAAPETNCVRGTDDGGFVTFLTMGRLTADDPASPATGDVYGYDADRDELVRISAGQGGVGGAYRCDATLVAPVCNGDGGVDLQGSVGTQGTVNYVLGVATRPLIPGDRLAFFESKSRLVPEDTDDAYDVYQWRDGDLSLVSTGASGTDGAIYRGNDATGRNVYFATRDQLSWQDHDAVADVYSARVGGGIAEPALTPVCDVLAHACRSGGAVPAVATPLTQLPGGENASSPDRGSKRLSVARPGAGARRVAARRGVLRLAVSASAAGRVTAVAKARVRVGGKGRVRRVARGGVSVDGAGRRVLVLRLSRAARRHLGGGRPLTLRVSVRMAGVGRRTIAVRLRRAGA
jgi:hypothetical protein